LEETGWRNEVLEKQNFKQSTHQTIDANKLKRVSKRAIHIKNLQDDEDEILETEVQNLDEIDQMQEA
jgi:hypothetical protein